MRLFEKRMLTKIDKSILAKYYDRRVRQDEEEEKQPEQQQPAGTAGEGSKLITTK